MQSFLVIALALLATLTSYAMDRIVLTGVVKVESKASIVFDGQDILHTVLVNNKKEMATKSNGMLYIKDLDAHSVDAFSVPGTVLCQEFYGHNSPSILKNILTGTTKNACPLAIKAISGNQEVIIQQTSNALIAHYLPMSIQVSVMNPAPIISDPTISYDGGRCFFGVNKQPEQDLCDYECEYYLWDATVTGPILAYQVRENENEFAQPCQGHCLNNSGDTYAFIAQNYKTCEVYCANTLVATRTPRKICSCVLEPDNALFKNIQFSPNDEHLIAIAETATTKNFSAYIFAPKESRYPLKKLPEYHCANNPDMVDVMALSFNNNMTKLAAVVQSLHYVDRIAYPTIEIIQYDLCDSIQSQKKLYAYARAGTITDIVIHTK